MDGSSIPASSSSSSSFSSSTTAAATGSSSSSSFVSELFGNPPAAVGSGGIFESMFSTTGVRREYYGSEGRTWKNEQSWQQKKNSPDGSSYSDREGVLISNKSPSFHSHSQEVVEHTLLSSSLHYGGRDYYVVTPDSNKYAKKPTTYEKNSEDVSDGGSPRGNFWQGIFVKEENTCDRDIARPWLGVKIHLDGQPLGSPIYCHVLGE